MSANVCKTLDLAWEERDATLTSSRTSAAADENLEKFLPTTLPALLLLVLATFLAGGFFALGRSGVSRSEGTKLKSSSVMLARAALISRSASESTLGLRN